MNWLSFFDPYSFQARLQPALVVLIPLIVTSAIFFPDIYTGFKVLVPTLSTFGGALVLSNFARSQGRAKERELYKKWGGRPTTIWLRHSDAQLDPITKGRYHKFLSSHVPDWVAPTEEQEAQDLRYADTCYDAAVKWLLEFTRNAKKYPLVAKENVAYGFRRNLYGLRSTGVAVTIVCMVVELVVLANARIHSSLLDLFQVFGTAFTLIVLGCWMLAVNEPWVKDAADGYARVLLASCDIGASASPVRAPSKKTKKATA